MVRVIRFIAMILIVSTSQLLLVFSIDIGWSYDRIVFILGFPALIGVLMMLKVDLRSVGGSLVVGSVLSSGVIFYLFVYAMGSFVP